MKPILLATDYSEAARNAGDYAAQLVKLFHSELIVFHSWSLPVMSGETIAFPVSINELEEINRKKVEEEAQYFAVKWGVKVKAVERAGFAADEIAECASGNNAGLIVMGLDHLTAGKFFGSVASAFTKHSRWPVLVVPRKGEFHPPASILLATDLNTHNHWHELDSLKELAEIFKSTVNIINVSANLPETKAEHGLAGVKLDQYMKEVPHQWHFEDDQVVNAIAHKAEEVNAAMVALVHHHLPWYRNIFHHSITREMTFATDRPLLILPGNVTHLRD